MSINEAGLDLLKEFERGRDPDTGKLLPKGVPALKAYDDGGGVWTISWGLTGRGITKGTVWSNDRAVDEFNKKVAWFTEQVLDACVEVPNENQLSAMVCLAFNIGMGWQGKKGPNDREGFRQSTVLRMHNAGRFAEAAAAFGKWNKVKGEVKAGLTRRRNAESALYLTPVDDRPQTTRAEVDCPPKLTNKIPAAVATVGATLTGAQQVVGQVEGIWGSLHQMGINPHLVMAVLGIAAAATILWFVYDSYIRRN